MSQGSTSTSDPERACRGVAHGFVSDELGAGEAWLGVSIGEEHLAGPVVGRCVDQGWLMLMSLVRRAALDALLTVVGRRFCPVGCCREEQRRGK